MRDDRRAVCPRCGRRDCEDFARREEDRRRIDSFAAFVDQHDQEGGWFA